MPTLTTSTAAQRFDIRDPQFTLDRFEIMAQMRGDSPVTFVPSMGFYAVTRYDDVRAVLGDAELFASSQAFSGGYFPARCSRRRSGFGLNRGTRAQIQG